MRSAGFDPQGQPSGARRESTPTFGTRPASGETDAPPSPSTAPSRPRRPIPRAELLRRTFGADLLQCPRCASTRRVVARPPHRLRRDHRPAGDDEWVPRGQVTVLRQRRVHGEHGGRGPGEGALVRRPRLLGDQDLQLDAPGVREADGCGGTPAGSPRLRSCSGIHHRRAGHPRRVRRAPPHQPGSPDVRPQGEGGPAHAVPVHRDRRTDGGRRSQGPRRSAPDHPDEGTAHHLRPHPGHLRHHAGGAPRRRLAGECGLGGPRACPGETGPDLGRARHQAGAVRRLRRQPETNG